MKADRNKDLAVPEFGPPRGVFYQQPDGEGKLSTYGDQALAILEHIVAHSGVDLDKLADSHASRFGAGSAYDIEGKLGHAPTKEDWPVPGPWIHHSLKEFLAHKAAGAPHPLGDTEDTQADGAAKIAAVVGLLAGKPELDDTVERVVRLTQNNDTAVGHTLLFAKLLEAVVLGEPVADATAKAVAWGAASDNAAAREAAKAVAAAQASTETHDAVVAANGSSCGMPGSLANAAHAFTSALSAADGFAAALRPTIAAPGCNCSRACMAGAVAGALLGREGLPAEWVAKTTGGDKIDALAAALAAAATA